MYSGRLVQAFPYCMIEHLRGKKELRETSWQCDGCHGVAVFLGAMNGKGSTPFLAFCCSFCFERVVVSTPKW